MDAARYERYRNLLLDMRARLTNQVTTMIEELPDKVNSGGELSGVPTHLADHDSEQLQNDIVVLEAERDMLGNVDAALQRLENQTFGLCTRCGKEIAELRLEAIPYTPHCIECASRREARQASRVPQSNTWS